MPEWAGLGVGAVGSLLDVMSGFGMRNAMNRVGPLNTNLVGSACGIGAARTSTPSCILRHVGRTVFRGIRVLRSGVTTIAKRVHGGLARTKRASISHGILAFLPARRNGAC